MKNINICTLNAASAQKDAVLLDRMLRKYDPQTFSADFGDTDALIEAVKNCAQTGRIVVVAAPLEGFLKAKVSLLKFFSSKVSKNREIIAAMGENAPESEKERDFHCAMPENSKAFVSADGLYSPFVKEHNGAIVMLMPLDGERIAAAFNGGAEAFFSNVFSVGVQAPSVAAVPPAPPKTEKSKVKPGVIAAIVIAAAAFVSLFALVAGIGVYVYFQNAPKAEDAEKLNNAATIIDYNLSGVVDSDIRNSYPDVDFPDGMLAKYAPLYAMNNDLRGYISIPMFEMNLPVVQADENSYYLDKDIYGNKSKYGTPFFDYRMTDFENLHKNTVIYGHNAKNDDFIFGMLENYRTTDGFIKAPVIECNTIYGDHKWFVYAVFITNSKPGDDNGYFLPYNFIDVSDSRFEEYIEEIDKRKLYTTGVDINSSDKILTLSTECYDFNDARLVVVARLQREGESEIIDTSKAYENPNPKYPQKWYDVNKKSNPYADDTRW